MQFFLRKIAIIFLSISLNMCFECSKEPSHGDGSLEYSQHMFWLRNKKIIFSYTLIWGPLSIHLTKFFIYTSDYLLIQIVSLLVNFTTNSIDPDEKQHFIRVCIV